MLLSKNLSPISGKISVNSFSSLLNYNKRFNSSISNKFINNNKNSIQFNSFNLKRTDLNWKKVDLIKPLSFIQQIRFHSLHRHTRMCNSLNGAGTTNITSGREILPKNVKPSRYDVTLDPNFKTFKFDGNVKIDLDVLEDTNFITLHSIEIEIKSAKIGDLKAIDISFNEPKQMVTFKFDQIFKKNSKITIDIDFIGILNDHMAGFYKSTYQDNGETKYLATTQMEATDCRRAFPSFDEPALKAVFDITLISDQHLTALSNEEIKEVKKLDNGRKATIFKTTSLMSTYLVAFIIAELNYIENNDFRVPIKLWATRGLEKQGHFSLDLIAKTLTFFEKAFDVKYPYPKLDYVAIPDFSAGAMENVACIFSREADVLFDEENSNLATKQRVAEVVQHELAHQWFGNLVTMAWWDGLWLNEGFATWMSWYSCDEFYPDWKVWQTYVSVDLQSALGLDALRSSHPIQVPVETAEDINQIFDAISYSKGSAVIAMLTRWLGKDVFIKGVSNYLKKHLYGNTEASDLWDALSEASGKDVVKVMGIWTQKVGYPILTVTEDSKNNTIHVKQNRYLTTGDVKPEDDETIYPIFLALKSKNEVDESIVFDTREENFTINDGLDFYKLNSDQFGLYRTSYPPERWTKLGQAGVDGLLTVEDRTGLVADAASLATSGYQSTSNLLNLVSSWKNEDNHVVWSEIINRVSALKNAWIFEDENTVEALKLFSRDLVSPKAHSIGWEFKDTDSFKEENLKTTLFGAAAASGDETIVKFSQDAFQKYISGDKKAFHPNLRDSIFATVARHGNEENYNQLLNVFKNPISVDEKLSALRTLGRFEDEKLIKKTFEILLDGTVKNQDIYMPMQGLRTHKTGIIALWEWTKENWDEIIKRLPPGFSMLGSVVSISTSAFTSDSKYKDIQEFFANKDTKGFDRGLARALDNIKSKSQWVNRDSDDVSHWLTVKGFKK